MEASDRIRPQLADADDRTLAGRAADGDVRAFEVLVRRYGPLMRAYATRILGSNADADDVVQESFIAAWQQLPDLENSAGVKAWMMRIASNKSIDRVRARREHLDIDDLERAAPAADSPARVAEARSQQRSLSLALDALPEAQRQCWVLKEVAGYSYDEISVQLEIPTSTVRGLLARARKTLMHEMEEWR